MKTNRFAWMIVIVVSGWAQSHLHAQGPQYAPAGYGGGTSDATYWEPDTVFQPGDYEVSTVSMFTDPTRGNSGGISGAAWLLLKGDPENTDAFFIQDQTGGNTVTSNQQFDHSHESAPRVWLGWQNSDGLAARFTWFEWDDSSSESATAGANFIFFNGLPTPTVTGGLLAGGVAGDFIQTDNEFEYYTVDAEITKSVNVDDWDFLFGGGYRHASLSQSYSAIGTAAGIPVSSRSEHRFDGDGPTIFGDVRFRLLGVRHRVGSAYLSFIGRARGSVIYGNSKLSATDINPTLNQPTVATASLKSSDSLAVGEVIVGGQVDVIKTDGTRLYFIVAFEGQWLRGVGSISSLSADHDLVLVGLNVSCGIDW